MTAARPAKRLVNMLMTPYSWTQIGRPVKKKPRRFLLDGAIPAKGKPPGLYQVLGTFFAFRSRTGPPEERTHRGLATGHPTQNVLRRLITVYRPSVPPAATIPVAPLPGADV